MPADYDLGVETYIKPIDLPLIHLGEKARIQFDGSAIIFNGWESVSYGVYGGTVAIETSVILGYRCLARYRGPRMAM